MVGRPNGRVGGSHFQSSLAASKAQMGIEGRPAVGARQIYQRIEPPLVPDSTIYWALEKLFILVEITPGGAADRRLPR